MCFFYNYKTSMSFPLILRAYRIENNAKQILSLSSTTAQEIQIAKQRTDLTKSTVKPRRI